MQYSEALDIFNEKIGDHTVMALASSYNDHVTVRNVSCINFGNRIYFKTDSEFRKTKQLMKNSNVALCFWGVQVEGTAKNLGLVVGQQDKTFETLYEKHFKTSYNAYPHTDTEILFEVEPLFIEIWDQLENDFGFQILIDTKLKTAEKKLYD